MAGLAILVAFTVLALAAPLFIHASDLDVIDATGPPLAPPSWRYPLGTDQRGPLGAAAADLGHPAVAGHRRASRPC